MHIDLGIFWWIWMPNVACRQILQMQIPVFSDSPNGVSWSAIFSGSVSFATFIRHLLKAFLHYVHNSFFMEEKIPWNVWKMMFARDWCCIDNENRIWSWYCLWKLKVIRFQNNLFPVENVPFGTNSIDVKPSMLGSLPDNARVLDCEL